jgi:hypothetical protein
MFISKAEKHNLYKLIADLQLRVNSLETELLKKEKGSSGDEAHTTYKKEYAQKYYWRKKAERLAAENKKKPLDLTMSKTVTITSKDPKVKK